MIAKQTGAPIVPTYLHRANKLWRALFARRHVRLYFGAPIGPQELDRFPNTKEGYRNLTGYVMEHIERMKVAAEEG